MPDNKTEIPYGTLDLLILKTLQVGEPMHGWGVSVRIQQLSEDVLQLNQGSLYPALYRLRDKNLITSTWGESDEGRRVKIYSVTKKGSTVLAKECEGWKRFSTAVEAILAAT